MELLEWVENNKTQSKRKITDYKYFDLCFVGCICLLSLILAILYVAMSKTVYFWDNSTYWDIGRTLAEKPLNFTFFKEIYNSIGTSDYNYFVAVSVALWMKIFGITRISYICAIVIFYLIPSEIVIYFMGKKISKAPRFAFVITLLSIPALWYITCIGFIDVAGVFLGLLCYYLYMTDTLNNKPYIKSIAIGVLLVMMMITRRYFAFFAVSFLTVMAIDTILIKHNIKQLATVILTVGLVLLVLFYPFFKNILLKDYGTLYSSYKYSIWTDLKLITRYFGTVFIVVIFALTIRGSIKRRELNPIFAILQILVCGAMFMSTQTHGQQHLFLYIPALTVLVMYAVNYTDKKGILVLMCAVALINTLSPFSGRVQPQNIQEIKSVALFPTYSVKPQKRDDINILLGIKTTLDKKIPEGKKCGVLASSFTINSSILTNVVPSLNMREDRTDSYIVGLPEVDSRDWWRLNEIYECDYILAAIPAQTHLAPNEQTIITEAVKSFTEGTDIAQSYSQLRDFKVKINDIEIRLYKRISPVTETAKKEYEMKLFK